MLCNIYVRLSRDLYFKKELHRIYRKTCLMGFSIGLRTTCNYDPAPHLDYVYEYMQYVYQAEIAQIE